MTVELTERQMQVFEGIKARRTPRQIADDMGISPQRVAAIRAALRDLGLIRQVADLPAHGRYTEEYPWVVAGDANPVPKLRLRLEHPQQSSRDLTVAAIRHVWWSQWSVQALPMTNPAGTRAHDAQPTHRVVVVTDLFRLPDLHWTSFIASTRTPWRESDTVEYLAKSSPRVQRARLGVTDEFTKAMTLMIATAVGVEAVFDLTPVKERTQ